jgi:hypothetical protein
MWSLGKVFVFVKLDPTPWEPNLSLLCLTVFNIIRFIGQSLGELE